MKKLLTHRPPGGSRVLFRMGLCVCMTLCCAGILYSAPMLQISEERINLEIPETTLDHVLWELDSRSKFEFFYSVEDVKTIKVNSSRFVDAPLNEVLRIILNETPVTYEVRNNAVVIFRNETTRQNPPPSITVTGRVYDESGRAMIGTTVHVKGTTTGTTTNAEGRYNIRVPGENAVLVFSFVGKETQEHRVGNRTTLDVRMAESDLSIKDVVVTGIFERPRESYTGAVTTITPEELKTYRGQNMLATLRNIDPAMNLMLDNVAGSNPNRLPEVNIRGNSSLPMSIEELNEGANQQLNAPLVIMDGFEISISQLMDFNDEEIASINILKDASATAIYGSRGANGVIVITTKTPQAGNLKIHLQLGLNLEVPDLSSYDLLGGIEKLELERLVGLYDSDEAEYDHKLKELYNARYNTALRGDTDWLREPVRVGTGQRINLRLEGGSDEFRWAVAGSNNMVNGAMKDSKRNTTNASVTLSYYYKNLIFRNQTSYGHTKAHESKYGSFSEYALMNAYFRPKDEDGNLIKEYPTWLNANEDKRPVTNPLYNSTLNSKDETSRTTITNNFSLDWNITPELRAKGQLGISKSFNTSDLYYPADHTKFDTDYYKNTDNFFKRGSYDYGTGQSFDIDASLTVSYSKTFAEKHILYAGFNTSIAQHDSYTYIMKASGFLNENFNDFSNALAYADSTTPSGSDSKTARVGFTGNLNYTYDNRYFVDGSFRLDGSSQFGADNKFAPFWSLGLGWNIHNEGFLRDQTILNMLRLRLSYGQTGSQQFKPYEARSMYQFYNSSRYMYWTGASLMGLSNEDLKWQRTDQWNGGVDFRILNGRISGGVDLYHKFTSNLLSSVKVPLSNGFRSYADNIGEVKNTGFEATLTGQLIRNTEKNILWSVTGKIAYNKNKIVKLSEAIKEQTEELKSQASNISSSGWYSRLLYEGDSQNAIYAVRSLGINPINGTELYLDKDGNLTTSPKGEDRVYCGESQPKYRGTISSHLSWKDFSLNISFAYYWGGKQFNRTLIEKVEVTLTSYTQTGMWNNVDRRVLTERWQKAGDVKYFKGYSSTDTTPSSRFVMRDNALELQSVSIDYRWRTPFVRKNLGAETINFSVNMSDVFHLSTIKRERGTDYPFARNMQFAISFLF